MDDMDKVFYHFDQEWRNADQEQQLSMVTKAIDMPPGQGIIPVLAGISSFHFTVRNKARKNLNGLKYKMNVILKNTKDNSGILQSTLFSVAIYKKLHSNLTIQELRLYLGILLESGGRSPYYAWKFCQSDVVSMQTLKNIISTIPDKGRLTLVYQYTKVSPSARRKNSEHFKALLKGIQDRKAVIGFYAWLFDMRASVDPFLENIPPRLRDPDDVISIELSSKITDERVNGVKALAMLSRKISPKLIVEKILTDKEPEVRMAGLNAVEISSAGIYSELSEILLKKVWSPRLPEAMAAFKALVVAGGIPLYSLEMRVRKNNKSLIPMILEELSSFSFITYAFIRELAEYPLRFLKYNKFFYQALLFAVIKKRPERVVRALEGFTDHQNEIIKTTVNRLIQLLNNSIEQEKEESRSQFEMPQLIESSKESPKEKKSFFKNIFGGGDGITTLEQKLFSLKEATSSEIVNFEGDIIENADLSSSVFFSPGIFNKSTIKKSDFSNSTFDYFSFKNAFIYQSDFSGSKFTSVSFDNAVFFGVIAKGSSFVDCSFIGASFHICLFESSVITESVFAGAVISSTSFQESDLSGSTFASSDLSLVSFSQCNLVGTDFSGVSAFFTKFSPKSISHIEMENSDLNSRIFQFSLRDMFDEFMLLLPDKDIFLSLNKLLYTELVHYGRKMFLRKNQSSILTAFDFFKPHQADLFELIPMLIHENIDLIRPSIRHGSPDRTHFEAEKNTPKGIAEYTPTHETKVLFREYISKNFIKAKAKEEAKEEEERKWFIESLFTIGSIGSIAQSSYSDIDYWVCIRKEWFDFENMLRFRKKLRKIETWAACEFNTEIHFFIVDINDAAKNDFGHSDNESSGSAQGRLLKEEFYRTMIHVAGKIPFWCTLPTAVSRQNYDLIFKTISGCDKNGCSEVSSFICDKCINCRYLNFGDIHDIPEGEYFGASIWQMFKLLKSPFKSVLKMGLLEKYIYSRGRRILLCNQFKDEWMKPGLQFDLIKNDPYYILLKSLVAYYRMTMDNQSRNLVLRCFFLKAGIEKESELDNTLFGLRSILIGKCMDEWGWSMTEVLDLGRFKEWNYIEIARLSHSVEQYMIRTYRKVSAQRVVEEKSLITPNDRTIIGRKMIVEFDKNKPEKIEKVLLVSRSDDHFKGLWLQYKHQGLRQNFWELIHKSGEKGKSGKKGNYVEECLKKATTIEEIGAWLVNNKLFSNNTIVNLIPNPTFVTSDNIKSLFNAMQFFFEKDMQKDIDRYVLLSSVTIQSIFVSMNLCTDRAEKKITECAAVYLNSWGEMFCHSFFNIKGFSSIDDAVIKLKKDLNMEKFPENNKFFFPKK